MTTESKVIELLHELNDFDKVNQDSSLSKDVGLDSLGMVTLLILLEDQLGVTRNESDMDPSRLQTVGDVVTLVDQYLEDHNEK